MTCFEIRLRDFIFESVLERGTLHGLLDGELLMALHFGGEGTLRDRLGRSRGGHCNCRHGGDNE